MASKSYCHNNNKRFNIYISYSTGHLPYIYSKIQGTSRTWRKVQFHTDSCINVLTIPLFLCTCIGVFKFSKSRMLQWWSHIAVACAVEYGSIPLLVIPGNSMQATGGCKLDADQAVQLQGTTYPGFVGDGWVWVCWLGQPRVPNAPFWYPRDDAQGKVLVANV